MKNGFLKRFISILLSLSLTILMSPASFASTSSSEDKKYKSYQDVIDSAVVHGVPLDLTYEDYISNYLPSYGSFDKYADTYIKLFEQNPPQTNASGSDKYYYNTGTSCPTEANYDQKNLLDVVKKGDIIYEANGGFGITGHIAIVEGIFSDSDGTSYIRIIEAISDGVVRSIIDDTRYNEKDAFILRVHGATDQQIDNAVEFCLSQLGKKYAIDFRKDTDPFQTDWYCSELVWAGYKNQGIDIETTALFNEPGVTPRDILNSDLTYQIQVA